MTKATLAYLKKRTGGKLTLAKLIWSIRQGEEMTQVEFAKLLNMSPQHLCDIEHGRKNVSPKLAANYAEKLGYSPVQFLRLCLQDMVDRVGLPYAIEIHKDLHRGGSQAVG
ncbi:MAG: helix-turn-helix transcriptional regulator [Gammaproteobacteria bacterium]|nr:helix-turn-helix transcriptional regulator [Gammaproteobacteria bacterium]